MVQINQPRDPVLAHLLKHHPEVELLSSPSPSGSIQFNFKNWSRELFFNGKPAEERGLIELMDNNPIVCASTLSIPTPIATLTTIALGPLIRAGLIKADPAIHLSEEPAETEDILWHLDSLGYKEGATLGIEQSDFQNIVVANTMVEVQKLENHQDLDDLYDEAYARSFYVRNFENEDWDTKLVHNKPWAAYRLRLTPGDENDLLTIQTMADRNGKCGACQVVHALNIMAGFEESLGIPENLPIL